MKQPQLIVLVWLLVKLVIIVIFAIYYRTTKESDSRIKQLQADSTYLRGMVLKCNGFISKSNADSSFYIK